MRSRLMVLSLIAAVGCSDSQTPTAPGAGPTASAAVVPAAANGNGNANGKTPPPPPPPAGFTHITLVNSPITSVAANQAKTITVACPAGTTAIGGGHSFLAYLSSSPMPWLKTSGLFSNNDFGLVLDNGVTGASQVNVVVTAYCAS